MTQVFAPRSQRTLTDGRNALANESALLESGDSDYDTQQVLHAEVNIALFSRFRSIECQSFTSAGTGNVFLQHFTASPLHREPT